MDVLRSLVISGKILKFKVKEHFRVRLPFSRRLRHAKQNGEMRGQMVEKGGNGKQDTDPMVLPSAASMVQTQCRLCS